LAASTLLLACANWSSPEAKLTARRALMSSFVSFSRSSGASPGFVARQSRPPREPTTTMYLPSGVGVTEGLLIKATGLSHDSGRSSTLRSPSRVPTSYARQTVAGRWRRSSQAGWASCAPLLINASDARKRSFNSAPNCSTSRTQLTAASPTLVLSSLP
jgi:hypothetical protein